MYVSKNGNKKTKKDRCGCCKKRFPFGKNGKGKFTTVHHLVFTSDGLQPTDKIDNAEMQIDIIRCFRNKQRYSAILCMAENGNGKGSDNYGCHNRLNDQIKDICCGIENIPLNGSSYVVVGICPLISGAPSKNKEAILPNEFCEFCFYFHAIFSPNEYMPLMEIISASSHYSGKVTKEMLIIARSNLQKRGIQARKIYQSTGGIRWKPIGKK